MQYVNVILQASRAYLPTRLTTSNKSSVIVRSDTPINRHIALLEALGKKRVQQFYIPSELEMTCFVFGNMERWTEDIDVITAEEMW